MEPTGIKYEFNAIPWRHAGPAAWYFVSLPVQLSAEIRQHLRSDEEGWGRLKATAHLGRTSWHTAIWYDTKHGTYLLPLKAEVRKRENMTEGRACQITIWV